MKRLFPLLVLIVALAAGPIQAPAVAQEDVQEDVQEFVGNLIDNAIQALKIPPSEREERREAFANLLHADFDLEAIRQRVMARYWRQMSEEQKETFAQVFDDYILNIYVGQLGPYNNEVVKLIRTERLDEDEYIVFTEVRRQEGEPLRLDWRVHRTKGGDLGVVDVVADGASLLRAKRDEFKEVIQRHGIDGLIQRIRDLNERLAEA